MIKSKFKIGNLIKCIKQHSYYRSIVADKYNIGSLFLVKNIEKDPCREGVVCVDLFSCQFQYCNRWSFNEDEIDEALSLYFEVVS